MPEKLPQKIKKYTTIKLYQLEVTSGIVEVEQTGPMLFIHFDGVGKGQFAFINTAIFISAKGEAKVENIIETVKQIIESKLNSSEIGTIIQINLVAALRENLNPEQYTVGSNLES